MSKYVTHWDQRRFLAAISGRVVNNMYEACSLVAADARRRAPVASGRTRANIAIETEITAREQYVEGRVGVRAKYYWAYFAEVGTRHMAAHPFLRPAVYHNAKRIVAILSRGL